MYEQTLTKAGLTADQAKVYEVLLQSGPLPAGEVSRKAALKRAWTYTLLEELIGLGLVEKQSGSNNVLRFSANHPSTLKDFAERMERQAKDAQVTLDAVMGQMVSDYNLIGDRPGIRFYEGLEGIKKVANDSLTSKTEILSYTDNEAIEKYIKDFNTEYVAKRRKLGIKKRMLAVDVPYIRERAKTYDPADTEARVIPSSNHFATVMQMYDHKVSYLTLTDKKMVGVIIEDPHIAEMHKTLFEIMWSSAEAI